jgi:hypothetical protein
MNTKNSHAPSCFWPRGPSTCPRNLNTSQQIISTKDHAALEIVGLCFMFRDGGSDGMGKNSSSGADV